MGLPISSQNDKFMACARAQDAEALAALYTPDAQVMPAGSPVIAGRADIANFWGSVFGSGITEVILKTLELDEGSSHLSEIGEYTLKAGDDVADKGSYIVIWHSIDGVWHLHRDMFNSSGG